jgi:hypothetical protein
VESLREAHAQLGNVDRQFTRIIEFWSGMSAALKILRDDTTASKSYLLQIENPKHADRFKKSIERAENVSERFILLTNFCYTKNELLGLIVMH